MMLIGDAFSQSERANHKVRSEHQFEIDTKWFTNLYEIFLTREIWHFSTS